jgi:hypothetical protein
MFRTLRRKVFRLALVSGAGAAATYFFDRERGPERREQMKTKADTLLKRSTPSASWQPAAQSANVFDTPSPSPSPSAAADPTPTPTVADIIATPDREVDPLAPQPTP